MILDKTAIDLLEQRYRTAFINSLAGFRQVVLVGTKSADGTTNLAIFNSLIHLGASPALFGFITRPDTVQRDTLQNILESNTYSFNYVPASLYEQAHQTSARYPKGISEFDQVGLTACYRPGCDAPFVEEAIVKVGMKFEERIPIPLNGTALIIGSITHIEVENAMVAADGFVDLSAADILISQGLDAYFTSEPVGRLAYAKP